MKKIAADLKLQLVPASLLGRLFQRSAFTEPNLAEGLPVQDQLFVVKDGKAELVADPAVHFDKMGFHDPNVQIDGNHATRPSRKGSGQVCIQIDGSAISLLSHVGEG